MKQPVLLVHEICHRNPKLSLRVRTVKNFYHQKVLVNYLKTGPYLLYRIRRYEHRVLLVEPFVWIHAQLVYYNESLLPTPEYLWLFEYLAVNHAVLDNRLRHTRDSFLQWRELKAHHLQFSRYYWGENYVMQGKFLFFVWGRLFGRC